MNLRQWKLKNRKGRSYAHFDRKVSLDRVWSYISNPRAIARHGFYPFIHYTSSFHRYNKETGIKQKERDICYSAHIDRFIYQYYGFRLNQYYNERVKREGADGVAIAYRDNLHKNNIHFAKRAIDFIKQHSPCYVVIGDFTGFFDNLDHRYLKEQLCSLLNVLRLPDDYYAVFKNITMYSTWELEDLLKLNGLSNDEAGILAFKQLDIALPPTEFKRLKKDYIKPHSGSHGIPQGSAISAVLSNIYMLEFDKRINEYVENRQGMYMRYSDDFIVILPGKGLTEFKEDFKFVKSVIDSVPGLSLEPQKTQVYRFSNQLLQNCNGEIMDSLQNGKDIINYLGFSFNGKVVSLRDKTVSKYYYKLYRKLKTVVKSNGFTKYGNRISCKNVYMKYSIKGANSGKGNFITYVKRAERIFKNERAIGNVRRRHMQKIGKRLNQVGKG